MKGKISATNIFFYLTIVIFLFAGCSKNKVHKSVEIYFSAPLFHESGAEIEWKSKFSINSFENVLVYELSHFRKELTDSVSINVKKFFIFNRGAVKGLMYIPTQSPKPVVYKVDSVLKAQTLTGFGDIITLDERIFVSKSVVKDTIKEVYIPKIKKDITYADTMVVSYLTKKLDLDYSLSKSIEKVKAKTVVKVNSIYNPMIVKGTSIPRYTIDFELRVIDKIPSEQLKKVQTYLKKFQQDARKLIREKL